MDWLVTMVNMGAGYIAHSQAVINLVVPIIILLYSNLSTITLRDVIMTTSIFLVFQPLPWNCTKSIYVKSSPLQISPSTKSDISTLAYPSRASSSDFQHALFLASLCVLGQISCILDPSISQIGRAS